MDNYIIKKLNESNFGHKLNPLQVIYPLVIDKAVLVMDKDDQKYVTLDTLDLVGMKQMLSYLTKFMPIDEVITTIVTTYSTNPVGVGSVVYLKNQDKLCLKLNDNYYINWNKNNNAHNLSSEDYGVTLLLPYNRSNFYYVAGVSLGIYKYSPLALLLVGIATGSPSDLTTIETYINNKIAEAVGNITPNFSIKHLAIYDPENVLEHTVYPEGSYGFWDGEVRRSDGTLWVVVTNADKYYTYDGNLYEFENNLMNLLVLGNVEPNPSIIKLKYIVEGDVRNLPTSGINAPNEGDYGFANGLYKYTISSSWVPADYENIYFVTNPRGDDTATNLYEIRPTSTGFILVPLIYTPQNSGSDTDYDEDIERIEEAVKKLSETKTSISTGENGKVNFEIRKLEEAKNYLVEDIPNSNRDRTVTDVSGLLPPSLLVIDTLKYVITNKIEFKPSDSQYSNITYDQQNKILTVNLESDRIIEFDKGGSFSHVSQLNKVYIVGNGNYLSVPEDHLIAEGNIVFKGTWTNKITKVSWFAKGGPEERYMDKKFICYNDDANINNGNIVISDKKSNICIEEPLEAFLTNGLYGYPSNLSQSSITPKEFIYYWPSEDCFVLRFGKGRFSEDDEKLTGLYYSKWLNSTDWNDESGSSITAKSDIKEIALKLRDYDGSLYCIGGIIDEEVETVKIINADYRVKSSGVLVDVDAYGGTVLYTVAGNTSVKLICDNYNLNTQDTDTYIPILRYVYTVTNNSWGESSSDKNNTQRTLIIPNDTVEEGNNGDAVCNKVIPLPRVLVGKETFISNFYTSGLKSYKLSRLYTSEDVFYDTTNKRFFVRDAFDTIDITEGSDSYKIFKYYSAWNNDYLYNLEITRNIGVISQKVIRPREDSIYLNIVTNKLYTVDYNGPISDASCKDLKLYNSTGDTFESIYVKLQAHYGTTLYDTLGIRNAIRVGNASIELEKNKPYYVSNVISGSSDDTTSMDDLPIRIFTDKNGFIIKGNNSTIYWCPNNSSKRSFFNCTHQYINNYNFNKKRNGSFVKPKIGWYYNSIGNAGYSQTTPTIFSFKNCYNFVVKDIDFKSLHFRYSYGYAVATRNIYNRWGGAWRLSANSSRFEALSVSCCTNGYFQNINIVNADHCFSASRREVGSTYYYGNNIYLDKVNMYDGLMCMVLKGHYNIYFSNCYIKEKDFIGGDGNHIIYGQDRQIKRLQFDNCKIVSGYYANGTLINWHSGGAGSAVTVEFNNSTFVGAPDIGTSVAKANTYPAARGTLAFNHCDFDVFDVSPVGSKGRLISPKFIRGSQTRGTIFKDCNIKTTIPIFSKDDTYAYGSKRRYNYKQFINCNITADLDNNNTYLIAGNYTLMILDCNIYITTGNLLYSDNIVSHDITSIKNSNIAVSDTVIHFKSKGGRLEVKDNVVLFLNENTSTNKLLIYYDTVKVNTVLSESTISNNLLSSYITGKIVKDDSILLVTPQAFKSLLNIDTGNRSINYRQTVFPSNPSNVDYSCFDEVVTVEDKNTIISRLEDKLEDLQTKIYGNYYKTSLSPQSAGEIDDVDVYSFNVYEEKINQAEVDDFICYVNPTTGDKTFYQCVLIGTRSHLSLPFCRLQLAQNGALIEEGSIDFTFWIQTPFNSISDPSLYEKIYVHVTDSTYTTEDEEDEESGELIPGETHVPTPKGIALMAIDALNQEGIYPSFTSTYAESASTVYIQFYLPWRGSSGIGASGYAPALNSIRLDERLIDTSLSKSIDGNALVVTTWNDNTYNSNYPIQVTLHYGNELKFQSIDGTPPLWKEMTAEEILEAGIVLGDIQTINDRITSYHPTP